MESSHAHFKVIGCQKLKKKRRNMKDENCMYMA